MPAYGWINTTLLLEQLNEVKDDIDKRIEIEISKIKKFIVLSYSLSLWERAGVRAKTLQD